MAWLRKLERLLLILGVLMLGIYVGALIHRAVLSRIAVQTFKTEQPHPSEPTRSPNHPGVMEMSVAKPDYGLWSPKRIQDYEESLASHLAPAIAILRIPKIHLEVPVLEGTDDLSLNRGVGRIAGTASLDDRGNIGIAGHRDGFFRGLKDVGPGDAIELVSPGQTVTYVVDKVVIVDPHDTSALGPLPYPSLTLVTCYPFYFVGSAPQRYIVQAAIMDDPRNRQASEQSDFHVINAAAKTSAR